LTWESYFGITAAAPEAPKHFSCQKIFIFAMLQLEIAPDNAATDHLELE